MAVDDLLGRFTQTCKPFLSLIEKWWWVLIALPFVMGFAALIYWIVGKFG